MVAIADLKPDLTVYEVGMTNTHTGVDEDPPEITCFISLKYVGHLYFLYYCCNFDFTRYLRTPLITKMSLGFLVMYGQRL